LFFFFSLPALLLLFFAHQSLRPAIVINQWRMIRDRFQFICA
jgi:hypothetical protein